MIRPAAAVILGYLTMAIAVMVAFAATYPVLGIDRLFAPGTYEAAGGWIALSFMLGLFSAAAGGWVCARIAPGTPAPQWLAAIVIVLGALLAVPVVMSPDSARGGTRPADATMSDAMTHARQPTWVALLNPLVGAAGVLLGAGLRRRGA